MTIDPSAALATLFEQGREFAADLEQTLDVEAGLRDALADPESPSPYLDTEGDLTAAAEGYVAGIRARRAAREAREAAE
jgi:hypothetical protein